MRTDVELASGAPVPGDAEIVDFATVAPDATAITVEFAAGIVMLNVGLIFLVVMGDIVVRGWLARVQITGPYLVRLGTLVLIFAGGVAFGTRLIRRPSRP